MYIVTGGAGFLGSAMVWQLNRMGVRDIIVVDNLGESGKWRNLRNLNYTDYFHKDAFMEMVLHGDEPWETTEAVIHMGACSSTTMQDMDYLWENNLRYSQSLCAWAMERGVRFINASSAATYGDGSGGFDDDPDRLDELRPLNPYGYSKHRFDLWARDQGLLEGIVSLKFFNVFGPNEYHKGEMRSMVCKAYEQITGDGSLRLFKSHREEFRDGGQMRDFVYVRDCTALMAWFLENPGVNGLFNVGTGTARTWNDLAAAVFAAMGAEKRIEYIPMPETIRHSYQYHTEAKMDRLAAIGAPVPSTTLEDAVAEYVRKYLAGKDSYL
ncbi:ADP-glyceromanno-heptose 6-epimerase [Oceanidesulfovibrio indonesiensis]|uniref:ADP-L-glycero-D-manno-heptose-6-epimerase n=1 Tax=Oceanidesulfovibrio indonesiensis TaxID=54767 RepID=A0A7M3MBJ3_9BACT|nr:ADP-glyceromanno-heptose 6-epimerase [Oceanidesulfovibrio indonesiensis]TVM15528.1 ADP-glyceromanno-heptose 6-epimerase [Oceanidesulfovibrio indonesiensis]